MQIPTDFPSSLGGKSHSRKIARSPKSCMRRWRFFFLGGGSKRWGFDRKKAATYHWTWKKRCANLLALLVVGDSDLHEQKQSFKYDEPYLEEIKHETSWIFYASKRHSLVICQNDPCQSRADYEYVLSIRHLDQTWLHKEEQQRWKDEGLYRPHLLEVSFPVAFCQQRFVNSDC